MLTRAEAERLQRARIVAALTEAVALRGFAATSVADIARQGGLSRKTFYRLFDNKADAFFAAYDAALERLEEAMCGAPDVASALRALLVRLEAEPALARLVLVEAQTASAMTGHHDRHLRPIAGWIADGEPARERAAMVVGMLRVRASAHPARFTDLLGPILELTTGRMPHPPAAPAPRQEVPCAIDGHVDLPAVRALIVDATVRGNGRALDELHDRLTDELDRDPPRAPRDRLELLRRLSAAARADGPGGVLRAAGHGGPPSSLSPQGLRVLRWIADHPGASGRAVQRGLGFRAESQVSRLVHALAADDLIEDRSDGSRTKRWHATPAGTDALR